ncbi:MAG: hypothetical protein HS104_41040 [Polyangiaceae bacterium]|nr:hypothetical protein [Polyangiaceae bacterium]MCE7892020.1 hypothetical protein [Sorangiineae bacterium PRO1]MCL4755507.1 hypothetical protein [Myxococcales bacterium]
MSRFGLSLVALIAVGCGPAARPTAQAPAFEPAGQSKCRVKKSSDRPLIIEWPSSDRAALESTAKRGLVVVRYESCEMEVLPRCQLGGSYRYTATTRKLEKVSIRDADELYAQVPVGAAKLEGKLEKAGELNVAMHVVGRFDAVEPDKPELEGACDGATHVVTAMTSGAFEFFAGAEAEAGGGASVLGAGAGAKSSTRNELLSKDGDAEACAAATPDASGPPTGCGAILRLEVSELGSLAKLAKAAPPPETPSVGGLGVATPNSGALIRSGPGVVKLHIESPDPSVQLHGLGAQRLDQVAGGYVGQGASTLLCRAPCDAVIDARLGQPLKIAGPDIPDSAPFTVYDKEGEVTARVRPGNSGKLTWSAITGSTGILAVITGGSLLLTGALINSTDSASTSGDGLVKWGAITLGGGVALTTAGVILWNSGTTDVTLEGGGGKP